MKISRNKETVGPLKNHVQYDRNQQFYAKNTN